VGAYAGPKNSGSSNFGLVIDIGNTKSYSGSGTTVTNPINQTNTELSVKDTFYKVYDLEVADYIIPNSPSTSLPSYSSSNGGIITFNGIGNYLDITVSNLNTTTTIEIWANIGSNYTNNTLFGFGSYTIWGGNGSFGFNTSNNDLYGISSGTVSSLGLVNNWKHYVFEMRSDVSYTNNKMYINTVEQTLSQQQGTENSSNRNFNNGSGRIASWQRFFGYEMPMSLAFLSIYNRSLTTEEIIINYNSSKGRFNL
jgi:hypothetical protein